MIDTVEKQVCSDKIFTASVTLCMGTAQGEHLKKEHKLYHVSQVNALTSHLNQW